MDVSTLIEDARMSSTDHSSADESPKTMISGSEESSDEGIVGGLKELGFGCWDLGVRVKLKFGVMSDALLVDVAAVETCWAFLASSSALSL